MNTREIERTYKVSDATGDGQTVRLRYTEDEAHALDRASAPALAEAEARLARLRAKQGKPALTVAEVVCVRERLVDAIERAGRPTRQRVTV